MVTIFNSLRGLGAKRWDNQRLAQAQGGGRHAPSQRGQVILVTTADFLDQSVSAQAFKQARDLGGRSCSAARADRGFAGR